MQLYVADYLGDTRHLTTEQHGAYLLLLMTMWRSDGVLPNDAKKLARIAGCTASRWARIADDVLAFFDEDGDLLTNKRLMLELEKAQEKSIKRAVSGSKGGRAKSLKNNASAEANATALAKHSSEPEPDTEVAKAPSVISGVRRADIAAGFLAFWAAYPKRKAKDAAAKAFAKAMARIQDPDPLAVILAGIERALPGWDDPQFIPHPATWLNAGSWDDEAPQPRRAEARNVRPDRHAAQHDHLSAVARAMAAACDRPEGEPVRDRPSPGPESGGRFLPAAA